MEFLSLIILVDGPGYDLKVLDVKVQVLLIFGECVIGS